MGADDFDPIADRRSGGDLFIAVLLLLVQVGGGLLTLLVAALSAMVTAPCAPSVPCGGEVWVTVALWTALIGGLLLLAGGVIGMILQRRAGRRVWPAAMTSLILQIGLLIAVYFIGTYAGPL